MSSSPDEQPPVALVTAGARRLGHAMSVRLAELGYDVAVHFNSSENDSHKTVLDIEQLGRRCFTFKRDFSNFATVQTLIKEVKQTMGRLDLLINNASVFSRNTLQSTSEAAFDLDFKLHVKAPYFLIQQFARECTSGQIINIVDTAVARYGSDYFSYLLSKKALYELTKMAAKQLAPSIRVNAIAPGIILAPENADRSKFEALSTGNLLAKSGAPADVLKAMEYIISATQVTGECLFVDGGDQVDY